jgi:hypothetical protein
MRNELSTGMTNGWGNQQTGRKPGKREKKPKARKEQRFPFMAGLFVKKEEGPRGTRPHEHCSDTQAPSGTRSP